MEKTKIVVVCGPTASGKTALAVDLAKRFNGEIVSADSMQIYKKLDIASAKPTEEEKQGVVHHLMDFLPPEKSFSVAEYVRLARETITDIATRGKLPVIAGGTGLYINSLVDNVQFDETESNEDFRLEMQKLADEKGNEALWQELNEIDKNAAAELHPNNRGRIIRALEIHRTSGRTITEAKAMSRLEETPYEPCMIALNYVDRQQLYDRINKRVDIMLQQGLLREAKEFFSHDDYSTAAQAIGYKELKPYFDGEKPLEECIERLKQQTRRYAKRQLTWFRRDSRIHWITVNSDTDYTEILENAENLVKSYSI